MPCFFGPSDRCFAPECFIQVRKKEMDSHTEAQDYAQVQKWMRIGRKTGYRASPGRVGFAWNRVVWRRCVSEKDTQGEDAITSHGSTYLFRSYPAVRRQ